ncbi:hypothetical protein yc1106_03047 [Curvularia clavata]|uniref:Swi5-domain-containing protein n=1 Tax=Curvularia clavata TaxID=95742 RepID=A0A9Q9DQ09_CURCL|nr:hypothetical protein yc1106_03047 [Curvularia clavata]
MFRVAPPAGSDDNGDDRDDGENGNALRREEFQSGIERVPRQESGGEGGWRARRPPVDAITRSSAPPISAGMAIHEGVTEIADSDEEPMTSSPFVGADDAADKLPAMASDQPQELQDALQKLHSKHQVLGQDDVKSTPQSTAALGVDRCGAQADFDASNTDHTDVKPKVAIHSQMNPPGFAPETVLVPVANSSMRQLPSPPPGRTQPCTAAHALDGSSAPKDARSKFAEDMTITCDSEAHDGRTHAGPTHVVSNGSSQSRSEDIRQHQNAIEYSDIIYPSENAVHRSQAMGISDTTRALAAAATNSLPPTTLGLTGLVSTPAPSKEGIAIHPGPDSNHIQDQKLPMNGGDCRPDITSRGPTVKTEEASPFTPQIRTVPPQEASQPSEASQGLGTGDTGTETTCESQRQAPIGASPTTMLTSSSKTSQDITLSELKAQKASLLASLRSLPAIQVLIEEMASSDTGVDGGCDEPTDADIMSAANKVVKQHIKLLHEYNELKDVGQGLMGLIADQRGTRIVEVQEEFGVDAKD